MAIDNKCSLLDINNSASKLETKLDSTFIPKSTTFIIDPSGNGDFTTYTQAVNYLQDKYSNGHIALKFVSGNHTIGYEPTIDGAQHNLPFIEIVGEGINNTIITCSTLSMGQAPFTFIWQNACMHDFTLTHTNPSNNANNNRAMRADLFSNINIYNIKIAGFEYGIWAFNNGSIRIDNVTVEQCRVAITAEGGSNVMVGWDTNVSITNCNTGFQVSAGGLISGYTTHCTFSGVTNKKVVSNGLMNLSGVS